MKKVLGIDIGTASIGWSYAWIDGESTRIQAGVRIVPMDSEQSDAFQKGLPVTINTDRRRYRGMRRNLDRYQMRRDQLITFFINDGWSQSQEELLEPSADDELFRNRASGVTRRLELQDFAKVILRLNKNRGFKSNRLADRGNEESSEYKQAIAERDQELRDRGLTIGQVLWDERVKWLENPNGTPEPHFESRTYSRASVMHEFDAIWSQQAKHHPQLTEEKRLEVRDKMLFYQRPLKSQKHLVGKCPFVNGRRVAPKSSPVFQEFRLWQDVKNLRVIDAEGVSTPLTYEQQLKIVNESSVQAKWSESALARKILGLKSNQKMNMPLTSNQFVYRLRSVFEPGRLAEDDIQSLFNVDVSLSGNAFDKQPSMSLWHLLYATEDEEALAKSLQTKFPFLFEGEIELLLDLRLPVDYGSLSHKAMREILPHLRSDEFESFADAAEAAGFNHSFSETREEAEKRELLDLLPEIKRNELRNPVVEKVLNQLVNLVNEVLRNPHFGRPDSIHIELAREMKQPAKKRKASEQQNRKNESERKRVKEVLEKKGIGKKVSRKDILRYQLAEECGWVSIYTGKPIEPSRLFNTQDYEIEHIIPQSRVFDDSFLNKTIAERSVNLEKGNMTAMEYIKTKGNDAVLAFEDRIKRRVENKENPLSLAKAQKLRWMGSDIPGDFIDRQLRETQYIAREAYGRMKLICKDVVPMAGMVTAYLRHEWGLDTVLEELTLPAYKAEGLTKEIEWVHPDGRVERKEIPTEWSKRTDHRHHAMDAIAISMITRSHIQFLNTLNERFGDDGKRLSDLVKSQSRKNVLLPPCEKSLLRKLTKSALEQLLVSRKPGKRGMVTSTFHNKSKAGEVTKRHKIPRGQLHKETVYGQIKRYLPAPVPLSKLPDDLTLIVDERERRVIEERLSESELPLKKQFSAAKLRKRPLTLDGIELKAVRCFERVFTQKVNIGPSIKIDKVIDRGIQEVLRERLAKFDGKASKAFVNLEENPIWLNQERTRQLRKVTVEVSNNALVPLRVSGDEPRDFVNLRNNHHLALYRDEESDQIVPRIVSFMEVVQRGREGHSAIRVVDEDGRKLVSTLAADEYVLFDVEFEDEFDVVNASSSEIAPHLFRVQKMSYSNVAKQSGLYLVFRHHVQATLEWDNALSFRRVQSLSKMPPWKVRLNVLGRIVSAKKLC